MLLFALAANPMPQGDAGRTPFPTSSREADIQLVSEHVVMDDRVSSAIPNFRPRAPEIKVPAVDYRGEYVFKNHGKRKRRVRIAFPIFTGSMLAGGFPKEILNFRASVDGRPLKVRSVVDKRRTFAERKPGETGAIVLGRPDLIELKSKRAIKARDEIEYVGGLTYKKFSFAIESGATRTLSLNYRVECGASGMGAPSINYIARSGALWRGKIEKATFELIRRPTLPITKYRMQPPATKTTEERLILERTNFKPDFDILIEVLVYPEVP